MDENKNRVWNALRIYYGIADSLEFSDENCTQTVYNNTLYIYIESNPEIFPPMKTKEYSNVYFVTGNPEIISFIRRTAQQYGCFCYANNYGLGYLYTVIPPNYKIHKKRKCLIKKIFGR